MCVTAEPEEHRPQHPGDFGAGMHRRRSPSHTVLPEPPCCTFDSQTSARVPPTPLCGVVWPPGSVCSIPEDTRDSFFCAVGSPCDCDKVRDSNTACTQTCFLLAEISHFFNLRVTCAEKPLVCGHKPPLSFCQSRPSVCISSVTW